MIERMTKLWTGSALSTLCMMIIASKLTAKEYGTEHQVLNVLFWVAIAFLAITSALVVAQIIQLMVETRRSRKATQPLVSKDHRAEEGKMNKEGKETKQQMKERFTRKLGCIYAWNAKAFEEQGEVLQKLGRLEDIEDELGIGLDVFHKLMEMQYCGEPNVLYVKDGNKIVEVGILELDYCKKKIIFYKDKNYDEDYLRGFWEYGETWALTKEELQGKERKG